MTDASDSVEVSIEILTRCIGRLKTHRSLWALCHDLRVLPSDAQIQLLIRDLESSRALIAKQLPARKS